MYRLSVVSTVNISLKCCSCLNVETFALSLYLTAVRKWIVNIVLLTYNELSGIISSSGSPSFACSSGSSKNANQFCLLQEIFTLCGNFSMANPAMVSTLVAHLQNFCWHSTKRQFYLLDGQAWYWTHVVCNDDMVCTCSCLDNQGIHLRGRQVHSETLQKGNSSCKSHLPWCTLGIKHLKASFPDHCWCWM